MLASAAAADLVADVERGLEELERLADPAARDTATAVVQALLELYGQGLERIVEEIAVRDDGEMARALAGDELVCHLLLLHGLHPVPVEARVREALGEVRPYLMSHGGDVELVGLEGTAVHVRLQGSCSGCPSSAMTLKLAVEEAIRKAAPEIEAVIADPGVTPGPAQLLQIEVVAPPARAPVAGGWTMVGGLRELANGGLAAKRVAGRPVLFLSLDGRPYAYAPACPSCTADLGEAGELRGAELTCRVCGSRYDALRAGRCLDAPRLHLEPVPLLVDADGLVKVAVAVEA